MDILFPDRCTTPHHNISATTNRLILALSFAILYTSSLSAQEIKEKQKTIVHKQTTENSQKLPLDTLKEQRLYHVEYSTPTSLNASSTQTSTFQESLRSLNLHEPLLLDPQRIGTQGTISKYATNNYKGYTVLMSSPILNITASSNRSDFPGLFTTRSANISFVKYMGRLSFQGDIMANQFITLGATNQFGAGGHISYSFSPFLSAVVFGNFYNNVPFIQMAMLPFIPTSSYGGYFSVCNKKVGINLGAERRYDPIIKKWVTVPIVTPKFKITKKMWMELPVGDMCRSIIENAIIRHRK